MKVRPMARMLWLCGSVACVLPVGASGQPATDASATVIRFPLERLQRFDPEGASAVKIRIKLLGEQLVQDTSRGGAPPTAGELSQIVANPDFSRAYKLNPDETLSILRWVDQKIKTEGLR